MNEIQVKNIKLLGGKLRYTAKQKSSSVSVSSDHQRDAKKSIK